jgi:hypothetical protein
MKWLVFAIFIFGAFGSDKSDSRSKSKDSSVIIVKQANSDDSVVTNKDWTEKLNNAVKKGNTKRVQSKLNEFCKEENELLIDFLMKGNDKNITA